MTLTTLKEWLLCSIKALWWLWQLKIQAYLSESLMKLTAFQSTPRSCVSISVLVSLVISRNNYDLSSSVSVTLQYKSFWPHLRKSSTPCYKLVKFPRRKILGFKVQQQQINKTLCNNKHFPHPPIYLFIFNSIKLNASEVKNEILVTNYLNHLIFSFIAFYRKNLEIILWQGELGSCQLQYA